MKQYKKIDLSEAALEDLVRCHAAQIEDGLTYIDHQKPAAGGRLDVLLVDSGKQLVVAELKVVQDDGMLLQGVDYYDHVASRVEAYAWRYKQHEIDPTQQVRLFLIAPSFSPALVDRCKWLNLPVSLFTFQSIQFIGETETIPVFFEQQITNPVPSVGSASIEGNLQYITDPPVRTQAGKLLDELKTWKTGHILIDAIKDAISIKVNGRVFAYFYPRRKHFIIASYSSEDVWTDYPVKDDNDLQAILPLMRAAMERKSIQE